MGGEHSTKELAPGTWHGRSRDPIWPYSLVPWRPWAGSGMAGGLCCSGHACGACPRPASCRRGSICRGPALRPEGLCSLTQVTFSPSPPSSALCSTQPRRGAWSGGRASHHLLRAASTPSAPPAPCAPSAPLYAQAGLACVFLRAGCRGRGRACCAPAQAALQRRVLTFQFAPMCPVDW